MNKTLKTILIILGAVVIALGIAGGSFYGGTAFQKSRANQVQEDFFATRGGQTPDGGFVMQSDGQRPGGGSFMGRGLTGEIQALDDDTLLITTNDGVVTVKLSDTTQIQKTVDISADELTAGTSVTIMGQQNDDDTISAEQIQVIDPSMLQQFAPPATGTAP